MDRTFLTVTVAVFLSLFFAVLLMASGVGSALEELFVGNDTSAPQQAGGDEEGAASADELRKEIASLKAQVDALRTSSRQTRGTTTSASGGDSDALRAELDELSRRNQALEREVADLYELISLGQGEGGSSVDLGLGENVTAEEIARHLADSPAMQSVIDQLNRRAEATAEEVYERKRREEEREQLVAQVERSREALENNFPVLVERMTRNLDLNEHSQAGVAETLTSYGNQLLDVRVAAFDQDWDDERRNQHVESMRESTVASLTSYGIEAEQAQRIVHVAERSARVTTPNAAGPQNLGAIRRGGGREGGFGGREGFRSRDR